MSDHRKSVESVKVNDSGFFETPTKPTKKKIKEAEKVSNYTTTIPKELSFGENVHQYLLNSTLHGLRYVAETNISIFERAFFIFAFILVTGLCIYFITNIYDKWSASPIIIALNAVATPITDIPFPAVTICNMNQAMKSYVQDIEPGTPNDSLLSSLCLETGSTRGNETLNTNGSYSGKWLQFRNFLLNVSQPCDKMLIQCSFATKIEKCMELFNTVLTDDGLCCTFNSVHPTYLLQKYNSTDEFDSVSETGNLTPNDWTPESGFTPEMKNNTYPRPAAGPGSHMGLSVVLNAMLDEYYCSSTSSVGFRILLHNPTETPKINAFGVSVSPGDEIRAVILPKISDASRMIRPVPIKQRQCVFANEGNLTYFRTYSRKNCEMECQSRKIQESCGCVLYYMPRIIDDIDICSRKDMPCVNRIKLLVELNINESYQCSCLPGCFEINYYTNTYASTLGNGGFYVRNRIINEMDPNMTKNNVAIVHIYYEDGTFRSFTKEQLIGFTEFLSNTGGLLGLFMGFSVVSLIELIYFISLRPYCAHKRYMNHITIVEPFTQTTNEINYRKNVPIEKSDTERLAATKKQMSNFKGMVKDKMHDIRRFGDGFNRNNNVNPTYPYVD